MGSKWKMLKFFVGIETLSHTDHISNMRLPADDRYIRFSKVIDYVCNKYLNHFDSEPNLPSASSFRTRSPISYSSSAYSGGMKRAMFKNIFHILWLKYLMFIILCLKM